MLAAPIGGPNLRELYDPDGRILHNGLQTKKLVAGAGFKPTTFPEGKELARWANFTQWVTNQKLVAGAGFEPTTFGL